MPPVLLSNLNVAFSYGFRRAVRVKQSQPLHLVKPLLSRNISSSSVVSASARRWLSCSSKPRNIKIMVSSGSIAALGDLVVDTLVSSFGNLSGYVKPHGVFFGDRGRKICLKGRVSIKSGEIGSQHAGFIGALVFGFERRCNFSTRSFSSSCYSDGIEPEVSIDDGSLSAEQLSSLAISIEEQRSSSYNTLKLVSGACYMPHPDKLKTGGEDAHFICADGHVIGVADGVGGWADVGVDSGVYARELMSNSVKAIREVPNGDVDPLLVLEKAHSTTRAMGSSTACIIVLKDQDLHAVNLGDSGFIIVRDGHTIFESPVQQHGFNFPYQLERGHNGDLPSSGQVFKISVVPGDVIVAGSDGLFDNVYNKEIAAIVAEAVKEGRSPDNTAQKIASFARTRALDTKNHTPFSTAAEKAGFAYYGGKLDDLTVVVSYISAKSDSC